MEINTNGTAEKPDVKQEAQKDTTAVDSVKDNPCDKAVVNETDYHIKVNDRLSKFNAAVYMTCWHFYRIPFVSPYSIIGMYLLLFKNAVWSYIID